MLPIRWRLTLFYTATILVIVALLTGALFAVRAIGLMSAVEGTTRAAALEAARLIESGGSLEQIESRRLIEDGISLVARDEQGAILAQTGAIRPFTFDSQGAWQEALTSGEASGSSSWGEDPYVYAVPVTVAGSSIRVVEAGTEYDAIGEGFVVFAPLVGAAVIAGVLLAIGGSYLLAWSAFRPVNAIVRSARTITEGDLSRRLPVKSRRDELDRLAIAFNELLGRIEVAFDQREAALDQQRRFVSDAGHELRTPLTSILGYTRMLRQWGLHDPEVAGESVAAMQQEAERMQALVEELLSLARGDESPQLDLGVYDLGTIAASAVEASRIAAGDAIAILYERPPAPVRVTIDPARIRRAVTALLDNAVKYTPAGGLVEVTVREFGDDAEIEVADSGIGIPAAHLPHVFERFYRVDQARAAGGAGLGLAIVRQIVEAHGGSVDVTSLPGRGSTFTLRIPSVAAAA